MNKSDRIKPCPFCDGKADKYEHDNSWWVQCNASECGARVRLAYEGNAIQAWNKRVPEDRLVEALEYLYTYVNGTNYEKGCKSIGLDKAKQALESYRGVKNGNNKN